MASYGLGELIERLLVGGFDKQCLIDVRLARRTGDEARMTLRNLPGLQASLVAGN